MSDLFYLGGPVELKHLGGTLYEASGALVLFGDAKSADFVGDYFTANTDYDLDENGAGQATVYYNHGLDEVIGKAKLGSGKARLSKTAESIWIKQQLDVANYYDGLVVKLLQEREKLGKRWGWSAGGVKHLVVREAVDGAQEIKKWPLGPDASITLIPADWRQSVAPIAELKPSNAKALLEALSASAGETPETQPEGAQAPASVADGSANGSTTPDLKNRRLIVSDKPDEKDKEQDKDQSGTATEATDGASRLDTLEAKMLETHESINKVLKLMEEAPRRMVGGYYSVDGYGADPNIKTLGDLALAIARGDTTRLKTVYGAELKTQSTMQGETGGFLIPETVLTDLGLDISLVSRLASLVQRIPVPTPSGRAPIRNYRTTPAGSGASASASGITSQKRKEGASYTLETMLLEEVTYNTSDFASGYIKATREQMRAAPLIETMLRSAIEEDVMNREEWAILRGSGAGEPTGVLTWDGKVLVEEDTDNTFVAADSDEMVSHLLVKGRSNVAWVYHNSIYTSLAPFVRNDVAVSGNRAEAIRTVFHGYEHFPSQHLPLIGTDGYIVLGDWWKYKIFEWEGLYVFFSEHRFADEGGKVAWFFGKNIDGKPILPAAVTLADGTFQASPFVVIKNKT